MKDKINRRRHLFYNYFSEDETSVPKEKRSVASVERRETPPRDLERSPPRDRDASPNKPRTSDPSLAENSEFANGGKRPLSRLVSGQKIPSRSSSPVNRLEGRDSAGLSDEDPSVVSARTLESKDPRASGC